MQVYTCVYTCLYLCLYLFIPASDKRYLREHITDNVNDLIMSYIRTNSSL